MTALVRAEMLRLTSRRGFRVILAVVVGVTLLVGLIVFLRASDLRYATAAPLGMRIAAQPLFTLSVVVGASFLGAEWACGAMTTLLTWEPRRGRVLAAKLVAAGVLTALATLGVLLLVALVLLPSGLAHGSTSGMDGEWWRSLSGLALRGAVLSAMGTGLGIGLAGLFRNSGGPIATWLVFEFVVSQLLTLWRPGLFRWLPGANVQQFLSAEEITAVTINGTPLLGFSGIRAGLVLATYAAGLLAASYAAFRARDVT